MGLFNLFSKNTKEQPAQDSSEANDAEELARYSGMRVEVTSDAGQLLFVAKLLGLRENRAELHQYSESEISQIAEPIHAKIRGYSDHER